MCLKKVQEMYYFYFFLIMVFLFILALDSVVVTEGFLIDFIFT